jgi:hypothetical protein
MLWGCARNGLRRGILEGSDASFCYLVMLGVEFKLELTSDCVDPSCPCHCFIDPRNIEFSIQNNCFDLFCCKGHYTCIKLSN